MAETRGVLVILVCAAFALLNGVAALLASYVGFRGHGSTTDSMLAEFNLGSGIVILAAFVGVILRRRWSVWVWALSTTLFFIGHIAIAVHHGPAVLHSPLRLVSLAVLPLLSLITWFLLFQEGKRGGLS